MSVTMQRVGTPADTACGPVTKANALSPLGVWHQVMHDAFGTKDVQDAPTLTYVWSADQFGHFNLGLVGSLLFALILYLGWDLSGVWQEAIASSNAAAWCATVAGLVFAAWFANKERSDFVIAERNAHNVFAFNRREVLLNCYVACFYTFAGIVVLVSAFWLKWWAALVVVGAIAINVPVALWWLRRKIAWQQADLPYLYRLANFPDNFENPADVKVIQKLADPGETPPVRHVLIDGPLNSGKTSLAVGVGTDFAFRLGIGRFISMAKLNQLGTRVRAGHQPREGVHGDTVFYDGRTLWPLPSADLLVIDDLDIGLVHPNPIDPEVVKQALLDSGPGADFFKALQNRRTLWIAGTSDHVSHWHQVVADLVGGGEKERVKVVKLRDSLPKQFRPRD